MIRKTFFWLHLSLGVTAGAFIFIMAATGVMLSFERQIIEFADRGIRSISASQDSQPRPLNELLGVVRRAGMGEPAAIVIRNQPQATIQFSIGRSKTVYVDPYSGAVLGVSSDRAHEFFSAVERLHRALGASLGSRSPGRWLTGLSNLLFGALILMGIILWAPRKWTWKSVRASIMFRSGLRGRAREWNWHNVVGIWCAIPLLVIVLTGVVMSFDWANALLFRLTGSSVATSRRGVEKDLHAHELASGEEPNYDQLLASAKAFDPDWRTITLNIARGASTTISAVVDAGTGGQPQCRTQYLLTRDTGIVVRRSSFADGSLGQRLRAFVRFGHTGEYAGRVGQFIAAVASLGSCVLVYSGLSLAFRRLAATIKRNRQHVSTRENHSEELTLAGASGEIRRSQARSW